MNYGSSFFGRHALSLEQIEPEFAGKLKLLTDLVQSVSAFVNKLKLFKEHIVRGDLTHFPPC